MEEMLRLILNELQELKRGQQELMSDVSKLKSDVCELREGQQELKNDISSIKDNLINGLGPYFQRIENYIDVKTDELKDALEDQQRVIDILSARSIKHESDLKDFKRIMKNQ